MTSLKIAAISAVALISAPALAATNFQTNFDSVSLATGSYTILQSIEGWDASGSGDGIEVQNHAAGTPFSESNLVELDSNNNSAMSRLITAGNYTLSFYYSARPGIAEASNGIDVLINGNSIFNITGNGDSETNWLQQVVKFNIADSAMLTFAAIGTSDSLGGYIDNVGLAAVPEAATWAMMIAGFGLIGAVSRRRQAVRVTFA